MYPPKRGCIYHIKWGLSLVLISFGCLGSLLFGADMICSTNIENWVPYYTNATEVSVEYDFIRARALGITTVILSSPDVAETVRQFYRDNTIAMLRGEVSQGMASTSWQVEENPDGNGSIIRLYSTCGQ